MSDWHWVKTDEWTDKNGVHHTTWDKVMYFKEQDMSDTSWIKPGMYVTVDRGPRVWDSGGAAHDNTGNGEVYKVKAVDAHYVACEHLRASGCSENIAIDSRLYALRELSPSYVEAMTGKEVEAYRIDPADGAKWAAEVAKQPNRGPGWRDFWTGVCHGAVTDLEAQRDKWKAEAGVDKAAKGGDRTAYAFTPPLNEWFYETYMGARQQGKTSVRVTSPCYTVVPSYELDHAAAEIAQLRKELEQAKKDKDGWREWRDAFWACGPEIRTLKAKVERLTADRDKWKAEAERMEKHWSACLDQRDAARLAQAEAEEARDAWRAAAERLQKRLDTVRKPLALPVVTQTPEERAAAADPNRNIGLDLTHEREAEDEAAAGRNVNTWRAMYYAMKRTRDYWTDKWDLAYGDYIALRAILKDIRKEVG